MVVQKSSHFGLCQFWVYSALAIATSTDLVFACPGTDSCTNTSIANVGIKTYFNAYNGMNSSCLGASGGVNTVNRCVQTRNCYTILAQLNTPLGSSGNLCPDTVATVGTAANNFNGAWQAPVRPNESCRFEFIYGGPNIWLGMPSRVVRFKNIGTGACVMEERHHFDSAIRSIAYIPFNPPTPLAPGETIEFNDMNHCGDGEKVTFLCGEGGAISISVDRRISDYHTWNGTYPALDPAIAPYSTHRDPMGIEITRSCNGDSPRCTNSACPKTPPLGSAGDPDQPVLAPID